MRPPAIMGYTISARVTSGLSDSILCQGHEQILSEAIVLCTAMLHTGPAASHMMASFWKIACMVRGHTKMVQEGSGAVRLNASGNATCAAVAAALSSGAFSFGNCAGTFFQGSGPGLTYNLE